VSIRGVSLLAVAACAALGLVGVSVASGASPAATSFYLDSYTANNASGGNSVTGPDVLVSGQTYTLEVQGTYSAWGDWPYHRCGRPGVSPVYRSPASDGNPVEPVGDDAVFRFAQPLYTGKCPHDFPKVTGTFQVNLGNGWKPFVPDGGVPKHPTRNTHAYTATIVGEGVQPRFRIVDWHPSDNDGQFLITIS
jgi:hypothetical protein